jgi:hypothetical protein
MAEDTMLKKGELLRQFKECYGVRVQPDATLMVVRDQSHPEEVQVAYLSPQTGGGMFAKATVDSGEWFYIDPRACKKI